MRELRRSRMLRELNSENAGLRRQVLLAKQELIKLEKLNGKPQIEVPNRCSNAVDPVPEKTTTTAVAPPPSDGSNQKPANEKPEKSQKKEKKPKKAATEVPTAASVEELPVDIGRLDLRVGKIVHVERHPDADSLYLEKIDCGEAQPRTVVSGLVKFVPIEQMQDRMVIVLCNLKPAKMRGIVSEAMVMCASTPDKVEVLSPPVGSVPGDLVHCETYNRQPDVQMNPKKKIFETVAPDLKTNTSLIACYKESPWIVPGKGHVMAQTLKNVNVK